MWMNCNNSPRAKAKSHKLDVCAHGTCFKRNHVYCHGNSTVINFSRLKKIWNFTFLQDLHINNRMWMANALWPRVESLYNRKYFHCITDHILSIQTNHTCTNKWHILEKKTKSEWVVRKIVLFHGKTNDKTIHMGNSNSNSLVREKKCRAEIAVGYDFKSHKWIEKIENDTQTSSGLWLEILRSFMKFHLILEE